MGSGVGSVIDAYTWARDWIDQPVLGLPRLENPATPWWDGALDGVVQSALESTGLLGLLEQVTGKPEELNAAAQVWHGRAGAMADVAKALRSGASAMAPQWEGAASDAFGTHMGQVVAAIDSTAADLAQTAEILATAALECRQAEQMVVGIIREAVEWMLVELAAWVALDIITVGLATLAEALVTAAEISVFIARVERVSVQLGLALRRLERVIKEMRQAEKAADTIRKANEARRIAGGIRQAGSPFQRPGALKDALQSRDWWANHLVSGGIKGMVAVPLVELTTGLTGDPVGQTRQAATSNTVLDSEKRAADPTDSARAKPYTVPRQKLDTPFG